MFLEQLDYWHWFAFAVVLIILELFAPGAFFIWLGISAAIVGLLMVMFNDMGWQYQLILFAIFSTVSAVAWKHYQKKNPETSDRPTLNRRGEQYVGRTFTLDEPIINNVGKIRVDDTMWKIEGDNCEAGSKVTVFETDGAVLRVKPAE